MPRFRFVPAILLGLALACPAPASAAEPDAEGTAGAPLGGGSQLVIGSGARCTAGFAAVSGTQGHLIAGPGCGAIGDSVTSAGIPVGTVAAASFPERAHTLIAVTNTSDWELVAWAGTEPASIAGSAEAAVGAPVCLLGSADGARCGTVQAKNVTINFPEGVLSGLTQTSACAEPGDRGGTFLSGDQAQGVPVGGSGDCASGGTSFFQPIAEILALYGLTLLTG
ncbi:S1 family peptidase [Amycolatopsis antarctica]|nr:S1 family peptidase [Amycolatopsis antarctica]